MNQSFRFCPTCGQVLDYKIIKLGEPKRHVCGACNKIHFQNPKLAAGVLFVHEDKLVLGKRDIEPGRGLWSYPGGFVEQGETVNDAALREAKEEAKADVKLEGLLGVYSYPGSIIAVVMYRGRSVGPKPQAGDEVQEIGLFSPQEIPWEELAFQSVRDSLKDYLEWTS